MARILMIKYQRGTVRHHEVALSIDQGLPNPLCGAHGTFMFIVIAAVAAAHLHQDAAKMGDA